MKILITGSKGFVGARLVSTLLEKTDYSVVGGVRRGGGRVSIREEYVPVGDISVDTDWSLALKGVGVVVHLAARAHITREKHLDPICEFRRVNVDAAVSLVKKSIACGVQRFVFVSSIGVNGSSTSGESFSEKSVGQPSADYARSKYEAEIKIWELAKKSNMELVVIRPPLVYAADAPGNFARLLRLVSLGVPLPLGSIENLRSMISLDNLVDFISVCIKNPAAANELFLISDGESLSTSEIVRLLARGMEKNAFLLPVPDLLLRCFAAAFGKTPMYTQLCKSLVIDSTKARNLLGWVAPYRADEMLVRAGRSFRLGKVER